MAWHPTRELLASCSYDDSIRLWVCDEGDWVCAAVLEGAPSGKGSIACCSAVDTLCEQCRAQATSRKPRLRLRVCMAPVYAGRDKAQHMIGVQCAPQCGMMPACNGKVKRAIRCHSCAANAGAAVGHSSTVWCVAFSTDGTQMASVSDDKTLRVWDLSWASSADTTPSCKLAATLSGYHSRTVYTVDWSPEGLLATGMDLQLCVVVAVQ